MQVGKAANMEELREDIFNYFSLKMAPTIVKMQKNHMHLMLHLHPAVSVLWMNWERN